MIPSQSEKLLTYLKNLSLLEDYCLEIYPSSKSAIQDKVNRHLCGTRGIPHLCHKICLPALNVAIDEALPGKKSVFFRCPLGLFSFAIPVSEDSCLLCSGMRENLFDLYFYGSEQFEFLKEKQNVHPYEILDQLEKLPVSTEKKVRETMEKVEHLIAAFSSGDRIRAIDNNQNLQSTFINVAEQIKKVDGFDEAKSLFGETLGILLDIPLIVLALKDEESNCYPIEACWGSFSGSSSFASKKLPFQGKKYLPVFLSEDEVKESFPGSDMNRAVCLPFFDKEEFFGMAVLFDVSLSVHELSLVEILTNKLVEKFRENTKDREAQHQKRDIRMLEMIRTLALTESQDDLLRLIMEMSAELVDASSGSLMLIDKGSKMLRITSSLGINPVLARSFSTRVGEGIAGRVAAGGAPILIKDIELEENVGRRNRMRFGTKSCISLPLRFKSTIIGVLNLADKKNNAPFTLADQDILSTFIDQATIILERTSTLKKAILNTITDPLTGLYNLRFIRKRLNEELSRSIRYNLQLSLTMVSLDNYSVYQEVNGRSNVNRVIKEVARALNLSLRDIDMVGRFSESEFCIILPSTPIKEAELVAERLKWIVERELENIDDSPGKESMTTSIGIASFPENGASSSDIINAARAALSQAEAEGGNKICSSVSRN
jgi:diguanylate cyclase (GGDEF)-like protein